MRCVKQALGLDCINVMQRLIPDHCLYCVCISQIAVLRLVFLLYKNFEEPPKTFSEAVKLFQVSKMS